MSTEKIRVLLVEDDINLGTLLKQYLLAKEYEVTLCTNGVEGHKAFMDNLFDICILDVMMPKKDGFSLAEDIRSVNNQIPLLFLTAKSMKEDVLEGFKIGADDYITKPFNMQELLFRVEAILRRAQPDQEKNRQTHFNLGKFTFDSEKQLLKFDGRVNKLTTKESELLRLMCLNLNETLERNVALKSIWQDDNYFNARSMDVYITKLRKHLKADSSLQIINVHGRGYKLIYTPDE